MTTEKKDAHRLVLKNKKAFLNYDLVERFEAGIVLQGTEIKSIRNGKTAFKDSYIDIKSGEIYVYNWDISPYDKGGYVNHEPERPKKLLVHKREIVRLAGRVLQKGLTLVPISLYFKGKHLKMEFALASGRKLYDKREQIAKKDAQREIEKAFKYSHR